MKPARVVPRGHIHTPGCASFEALLLRRARALGTVVIARVAHFVDGSFTGTERFVLERRLGAGSMGAVYLAYDRQLESRVALKVLLSVDASSIYRFKKEFRALADVAHPNLVTLHELFSEGEQWFFTMEYVEGRDLLSYLHGGRRRAFDSTPKAISELPPDQGALFDAPIKGIEMLFPTPLENEERLRAVLVQVVEGLSAVHAAGKLHRDLKPENVLVTPQRRAVLLDFGIVVDHQKDIHETLATIIGTPAYMSPEQCRGQGVSEATDWYALGVILYEALTGDVPFDGTPMQVIARKQEADAVPPAEVVSGVPDDLNALCMQLLQRDPSKRPDGAAILRALRSKRAASLPVPAETTSKARRPTFVGREAQLRELHAALSVTEGGQPVVLLLQGPSGIGKSSLVHRFIEEIADAEQAIVLQGRCYERESVPFKAFDNVIDSLSRYLRRLAAVDAARVLPRDLEALATLFPVLKRVDVVRRDRRTRAMPLERQELRQRAFRALKEMFGRIADVEPLVIYIDDLQWSDVDSAKLLGELVTGNDRPALMLICAYRSGDSEQSPGLKALLEQVQAGSGVHVRNLPIGVLSPEDSFTLARELLGPETGEEGARKIGFESGGNPHVLTQLVRHVEERRASGRASPETAKGLINFERVLDQRLASLSTDARTLLELLSVAGRPVPEVILALVSSFNIDLPTALAELRGAKLVRGVSSHSLRAVEVYHDAIREAVAGAMSTELLASWHRRLAAALEASGARDLEALTEHLLGAGDHQRASLYAARAATQAEKALAFDKAARLYGIAAEHCPEARQRRELLRHWAGALVAAGRGPAAARAYVEAARAADDPAEATRLTALAGVQQLLSGELDDGLALLQKTLPALGVGLAGSRQEAFSQVAHMWRELRGRGFAFDQRPAAQCDERELSRLDLLWGVTRGLLLHELDRPLPLLARYVFDALELGEPLRIVRGLAFYHVHIDVPFSRLSRLSPSGALDVAEAVARRLDQVEAHAVIAFAKGLSVYENGRLEPALHELQKAEDLYRNHCSGGAFEMRLSRMVMAQLLLIRRQLEDLHLLKDWVREAEDRGDRVSSSRLRMPLVTAFLVSDEADAALTTLDAALEAAGSTPASLTLLTYELVRGLIQLYRGNADGCRASYYLLDEFFTTPMAAAPLQRVQVLLLRARLAIIARAGGDTGRAFLDRARSALKEASRIGLPCFRQDVLLTKASLAMARGNAADALEALEQVLTGSPEPTLAVLVAQRAKGHILQSAEGRRLVELAEQQLGQRGILNPRRVARLFVPGLEEMADRLATHSQPPAA